MGALIRHAHTIVFVADLARSTAFYRDVLDQKVVHDWGFMILFEHDFGIHDAADLMRKVYKGSRPAVAEPQGRDNMDIYFETDDLEGALGRVVASGAEIIHPIEFQPWGQRVFRFHDPDGHIVEIGEPQAG